MSFKVYIDGNFVKEFPTHIEAYDFRFVQYAILENFPKECIEIKEEL